MFYKTFFCHTNIWQLQSHNGHFSLTECSLNHRYNFTRGFPTATFAAIPYSPLVTHKLLLQNQDHLAGLFPNKHSVRCYFHFVSPAGMMDLPFPEDFTHVGQDKLQWEGAQTAPTGAQVEKPIHLWEHRETSNLGINYFFSKCQESKEWSFSRVKGSWAINNLNNHLINFREV